MVGIAKRVTCSAALGLALGALPSMVAAYFPDPSEYTDRVEYNNKYYYVSYAQGDLQDDSDAMWTSNRLSGASWFGNETMAETFAQTTQQQGAMFGYRAEQDSFDGNEIYAWEWTGSDVGQSSGIFDQITYAFEPVSPKNVPEIDGAALAQGLVGVGGLGLWVAGRRRVGEPDAAA
ncbi:hypothetical protein V6X63_10195 [Spiribacter sp. 221]|uniref:hypothetical protein n=1 Tax=Spiribacter onubensis TaxID=3122420 RepID=UPI00349F6BF3